MFLISALCLLLPLRSHLPADSGQDSVVVIRRIAATAALAAEEYGNGIRDGRLVAPAEVEEAKLFLSEARRSANVLPEASAKPVLLRLDVLMGLVSRTAAVDSVAVAARDLGVYLTKTFDVSLEEIPEQTPSLAQGARIYASQCASCHGQEGRGDGPAGTVLVPPPADLTDFRQLTGATPLDFYRRITIGVTGTAMPAFEGRLSANERWSAALYASVLRDPSPAGAVPTALRSFPVTARMSDSALAGRLAPGADPASPATRRQVAAVRSFAATESPVQLAGQVFGQVRSELDSVMSLAQRGQGAEASAKAFDAYMTFEQVERGVRAKAPALATDLESDFAALRTRAAGGATAAELGEIHSRLLAGLENAERTVGDRTSPANLFVQSFVLLLREGLEAILVVGAVMAFLVRIGAGRRRRDIHAGVAAAIGASLLTALLLETILNASRSSQEALEGGVMLVATGMLFYVSYWLVSKMEVAKWNRFVKGRVQEAVSSGSALALASVAFLAVYREGFETVLFYQALFLADTGRAAPVFLGMVAGGVALAVIYLAINRWGVRIPLKPFFGVTSAFLYYMAFVFAGKGVAELQEGQLIRTTVLPSGPRLPALGIYPTMESLALQGLLLLLLVAGIVWTFVIEPRRLPVTSELVPEPVAASAVREPAPRVESDMLRSLERMDADLAELRAEIERLKALLSTTHRSS
ncbi:MAG TPA: FTR1 family protein [Gemmatimonadales bacterium]|nr:FTR1 family protein [Gemmatimonadales bacterium]